MRRFFVPTVTLLKICLIPLAVTVLGIVIPALLKLALIFDLILLLICLYEIYLMIRKIDFTLSVKNRFQFYIDRKSDVLFEISNTGSLTIQAQMLLDLPRFWSHDEGMEKREIQKGETQSISLCASSATERQILPEHHEYQDVQPPETVSSLQKGVS